MTAYTGSVLTTTGFGRQDEPESVLVKASWDAELTTDDTLTVANAIPPGLKLIIDDVEVFGTIPDVRLIGRLQMK